jgi:hypothetical protein
MIRIERARGEPVVTGGVTVVPVARRIAVGAGLGSAAAWFVHDGPAAVEVTAAGETRSIPIRDVTLAARLALIVIGLLALAIGRRR